jgi:hypothetical protein
MSMAKLIIRKGFSRQEYLVLLSLFDILVLKIYRYVVDL